MSLAPRISISAAILAALAAATITAMKAVPVDEAAHVASTALASWPPGVTPPAAQWSDAWGRLQAAHAVDDGNPVVLELMGLLAARRFDDYAYLRQAPGLLARSLSLRPVSARTWASYAEASYLAGDTSMRFETALVTAARLGPSDPHVQRMLAHYGLAVWDQVAPATRAAVDTAIGAAIRRNPLEMLRIAERRGRLSVACRHVSGASGQLDPNVSRLCPRRETAR